MIIYRDDTGTVVEEELYNSYEELTSIDFYDGYAYYTSAKTDGKEFALIKKRIPISAIVKILY